MNIFKKLFGGKSEQPETAQENHEEKDFDVLKYDGVRAMRTHQLDYAAKCFTHALDIKDDLETRDYLSQVYVGLNNLPDAYEQLRQIGEACPDNIQVFIRMARVAYMMEDYKAMGEAAEKAMLIDRDNAEVNYLYAQSCDGMGDVVNAIALLTKAISLDGNYVEAYLLRGAVLLKMGDKKGASDDADAAVKLAPDNEDALLLKARVENALGEKDSALSWYGKVIDANPFRLEAYKERGAIHYERGETQAASDDMKKVLELEPEKTADVTGDFSAEGIEDKINRKYKEMNPYGF